MSGANVFRAGWSYTDTGSPVSAPALNAKALVGSIGAGWIMTRCKARMWLMSDVLTTQAPSASAPIGNPFWVPKLFGVASVNTPSVPGVPSDSNIASTAWLVTGAEHSMNSDIEPGAGWERENWRVGWATDTWMNRNPNPVQQDIYVAWSYLSPPSGVILYAFSGEIEIWYG